MKRRLVLKQIALASAAVWLLPSCVTDSKKLSIALNNLKITSDEEELIGQIADIIIPATNTPGAVAVEAHLFTMIMVDDCLSKNEQQAYLKGMRSFDEAVKSIIDKTFGRASSEERLKVISKLDQDQTGLSDEIKTFYKRTRAFVIQGYLQSQHFLTSVKPYQLIPGPHFSGCVPVANKNIV